MENSLDQEATILPMGKGDHTEAPVNPSGHRQELDRNFHLIHICGMGITTGNTWIAIGGSIVGSPTPSLVFYWKSCVPYI